MIAAGTILQQRYRIERQIGQGGMGAVYVATDERFGSRVAIKETLCLDESYRRAIAQEARLLNNLKHPALPRVTDHFIEDRGQFLVMEYIPGVDVAVMLQRMSGPFAVPLVLQWADHLLDALDYLHGQQTPVIHRDIKPQNLKITPQGQVVLLDFGLAKGNPTDASQVTASSSIFGYSRNYASLEQIQGTGTDPRSDLYSLAATLYHLLTGRLPADALTRAMRVLGRHPDPLAPLHEVRKDIPLGVSAILTSALQLDAESRPGSATLLRRMLRSHDEYRHLALSHLNEPLSGHEAGIEVETHVRQTSAKPQSGIQTEVISGNLSQLTSVRTGLMTETRTVGSETRLSPLVEPPRSRTKLAVAAASAVILFAVCVAAAGLFYFGPPVSLGFGRSAEGQKDKTVSDGGVGDPMESGDGVESRAPNTGSREPQGQPAGQQPPPAPREPPVADNGPADPAERRPKVPDRVRSEQQAPEPREKRPEIRVDSIEIDRLPGGVRGVKLSRTRSKKPDPERDDDGGFKISKVPNIFRKVPSKLSDLVPRDRKRKQTTTRQD